MTCELPRLHSECLQMLGVSCAVLHRQSRMCLQCQTYRVPAVRRPPRRAVRGVLGELRPGGGGLVAWVGGVCQEHPPGRAPSRRRPQPEQEVGRYCCLGRNTQHLNEIRWADRNNFREFTGISYERPVVIS